MIQQKVEDPLSDRLLSGEFVDGASILVDVGVDGEIILERSDEKAEAPRRQSNWYIAITRSPRGQVMMTCPRFCKSLLMDYFSAERVVQVVQPNLEKEKRQ